VRALSLIAAFLLVTGVFCGGAEEKPAEQAGTVKDFPAEAFAEITDAEMQKFITALPKVGEALNKAGFTPPETEDADIATSLATVIEAVKPVPGVEAALKETGTNWPEFRVTMYKVMVATAAFGVEMASAMAEGMADDTTAETREAKAELEKAKEFTSKVPQKNKDMVIQHMDALQGLEALGG